ncbi:hypothetical protein ACFO0N_04560 [Halobium salinum]|uniref:DUF8152 domain-containing protein n=1 Tax=Halobium salinum TaxID=1364940 RepID=A0ABD5P919_9EURY|nr:hypothetical protein [Halobium salinum]
MSTDETPTLADRTADLHAHLEATEEQPIDATANRWIGEAEAVAGDVAALAAGEDVDESVVAERVGHVRELLSNVDETGDSGADEHVAAARAEAEGIIDRIEAANS